MPVFRKKSKKSDDKFIGGNIPDKLFQFVQLYIIANSISKTKFIAECIELFEKDFSKLCNENDLIQKIAVQIKYNWKIKKKENPNMPMDIFLDEVKTELINRGINSTTIDKIFIQTQK